jgi:O-antigen/teichoic acid export membrane protein
MRPSGRRRASARPRPNAGRFDGEGFPLSARPNTSNTQIIARNSFWWGLELFFSLFAAFLTSIFVARIIGPERLGYFQYVVWLTNITTAVGSFGLPTTTCKYMAEYLNRGEPSVARSIYSVALRIQMLIACGVAATGLALVYFAGDPAYRLASVLLVINMAPRMIALIPSQANNAAEMFKRNTPPAIIGASLNIALTLTSLWVGWDLTGIAAGFLAGSIVEASLKVYALHRRSASVPRGTISPELKKRMLSYSGKGLVLMLLNVLVWDRSDLLILKNMNPDIKQVTFFSLAFNLTERVLIFPNSFANSLGATIMAQFGRGRERAHQLTVAGAKYAFLIAVPLLLGMACLGRPLVHLLYGYRYEPLFPVLAIAAVLAIPKALMAPPTSLLQSTENQGYLIWVGCCGGALDLLLDVLLTPVYGARGAALANGLAQTAAAIAIWIRVRSLFRLDLRLGDFARIAGCGAAMASATLLTSHYVPGYAGVILAVAAGALVWFAGLRLTGAVGKADGERLLIVAKWLPARLRGFFTWFIAWLAHLEGPGALSAQQYP